MPEAVYDGRTTKPRGFLGATRRTAAGLLVARASLDTKIPRGKTPAICETRHEVAPGRNGCLVPGHGTQEAALADEGLPRVRAPVCVAQEMGTLLGRCPVLFRCLPTGQGANGAAGLGLAVTMQLGRSCLLDLLAQIHRRSLVTGPVPARASPTPRLAQASASQSLPSQLNRPGVRQ